MKTSFNSHNSKSNKTIFNSPLTFKNYIDNKIKQYNYRDLLYSHKNKYSMNTLYNINLEKKIKNINNSNYNSSSDNSINKKITKINKNKKELKKKLFNKRKNNISKDKSIYGYLDNKEFYLGNEFSKKLRIIFKSPIHLQKHNFPLIDKEKSSQKYLK